MTNWEIMKKYLLSNVISALLDDGFTGSFPHYRKNCQDGIELITFQRNKYGGCFTVEVSAVFPDRRDTNCVTENPEKNTVNVWDTNRRYRLKGMYDGWFYYQDLYARRIVSLKKDYLPVDEGQTCAPSGYKIVQSFNEDTAKLICDEVNRQLTKAFIWLRKFKRKHVCYRIK